MDLGALPFPASTPLSFDGRDFSASAEEMAVLAPAVQAYLAYIHRQPLEGETAAEIAADVAVVLSGAPAVIRSALPPFLAAHASAAAWPTMRSLLERMVDARALEGLQSAHESALAAAPDLSKLLKG